MFYGKFFLKGVFSLISYLKIFQYMIQKITINRQVQQKNLVRVRSNKKLFSSQLCLLVSQIGLVSKPKSEGFGLADQFHILKVVLNQTSPPREHLKRKNQLSVVTKAHPHSIELLFDGFLPKRICPLCYFTRILQELLAPSDLLSEYVFLNQWDIWVAYQVIFFFCGHVQGIQPGHIF